MALAQKKRKMKTLRIAGLSILCIAAAAFAADGIVLKMGYKKGDIFKTRTKGNLEIMGQPVDVTLVNQEKVVEVAEDGTVTLESSMVEGKAIFGGQEMDLPAGTVTTMVLAANGSVKDIRGDEISADIYRLSNLSSFNIPTEAVKVGSKWKNELKADTGKGFGAVSSSYEIVGEEKIGKYDCFKVMYKSAETEGGSPASMEGTIYVNKADATLIKGESKWANVPMSGAPAPITGTFTTVRED
jgi:hypothetical protein